MAKFYQLDVNKTLIIIHLCNVIEEYKLNSFDYTRHLKNCLETYKIDIFVLLNTEILNVRIKSYYYKNMVYKTQFTLISYVKY